jgi:hypothetical protein
MEPRSDPVETTGGSAPNQKEDDMRFIAMVKANKLSESGAPPDPKLLEAMGKYNEELARAGVLLAGEGLQPSSKGARIKFSGGKRTVIDGPFTEAKELVAGFWMIQAKSKQEAIEWIKRCPHPFGEGEAEIEIRQVYEASDFGPEVEKQEGALREEIKRKAAKR